MQNKPRIPCIRPGRAELQSESYGVSTRVQAALVAALLTIRDLAELRSQLGKPDFTRVRAVSYHTHEKQAVHPSDLTMPR